MSNFRPVPKPRNTKKKKLYNGIKNKAERVCYYCGTPYAERHEVYGGPNRQASIELGFQVDLCSACHSAWHAQEKDLWIRRKKAWQEHYQRLYEGKLKAAGVTPERARVLWMSIIGKNYTDEVL